MHLPRQNLPQFFPAAGNSVKLLLALGLRTIPCPPASFPIWVNGSVNGCKGFPLLGMILLLLVTLGCGCLGKTETPSIAGRRVGLASAGEASCFPPYAACREESGRAATAR